mgnify:CR=1 FL=1
MKLLKTFPSSYYILYTIFLLFLSHTIFYLKNLNVFLTFVLILFIFTNLFLKKIAFPKFTLRLKVKDFELNHIMIVIFIIFPSIIFLNNISFGDLIGGVTIEILF